MMNPQRAAHMMPTGTFSAGAPGADDMGIGTGTDPNAGVGTAQSGYATPDNGPFECGNCVHFDGQNKCDNPQVVSDPEVHGQVEEDGCCNLFSPGTHEGGEQEEHEGETGAIAGAGEGGQ